LFSAHRHKNKGVPGPQARKRIWNLNQHLQYSKWQITHSDRLSAIIVRGCGSRLQWSLLLTDATERIGCAEFDK